MHLLTLNNALKWIAKLPWVGLLLCLLSITFTAGCGKRKLPLPPVERVVQRSEVSGAQRGNRIFLQWTMPPHKADDKSILSIQRVDIYRLAEPLNAPLSLTEEEFASRSTLIASVPVEDKDYGKPLNYTDTLEFAGQAVRLRYALRFVNTAGQKAAFSNFLLIEPSERVASNPTDLKAGLSEDAVTLSWIPPDKNINGTSPANIMGFNVYREKNGGSYTKLNGAPVTKNQFADEFFDFGVRQEYFVRTVSLGSNAQPIESTESNTVSITPKDTFPPSPPAAITIAAAPGTISIFFATNPEKDIAGYKVYRSEDENLAKPGWKLLTPQLLQTNVFHDTNVESGRKYFYYLAAVDKAGNISEISEVVSETAP
jgi:fibronectin type 3 domain-containing protein